MKIAILGFAGQGQSSYEYWNTPDNELTICDQNPDLEVPEGASSQLGADYLKNLDAFDLIVRTPILHPRDIVNANPDTPTILDKVTSNTNEFFRTSPTKNIIGVTGTKGKGTTSTLITRMLEAAGKKVHLGGNIGIPPIELLKDDIKSDDWVVLELANFQLIDLKYSPHIAVCLMVQDEHLDWHEAVPQLAYPQGSDQQSAVADDSSTSPLVPTGATSKMSETPATTASRSPSLEFRRAEALEEYIAAKQQLFIHQNSDDVAIYYAKNEVSESIADASGGKQIPYYDIPGAIIKGDSVVMHNQEVCKTSELKLLGKHNWQNVCAAITAVWQVTQDVTAIKTALVNFSGLPFRIEFRREVNGIRYYNDSFATGQGATIAALEAVPGSKVMIIGGYDRMLKLDELAEGVVRNKAGIRKVLLIGASAERTAEALAKHKFTNFAHCQAKTMPEIVSAATTEAQRGDAVVLSPSFASFDMFKNFEERGNLYNEAVAAL